MEAAGAGQQDAGSTVQNLMSLYGQQQAMAGQQALLAQSPEIAQRLGMSESVVRAQILAGHGDELVKSMEPTETTRNYQQARNMLQAAGVPDDQIDIFTQPMLLGAGANPAMAEYIQRVADAKKNGTLDQQPELKGGFYSWMKTQELAQADKTAKQGVVNAAQASYGDVDRVLTTLESQAEDLRTAYINHKLDKLFQYPQLFTKAAAGGGGVQSVNDVINWFTSQGIGLTDAEKGYVKDIMDMTGTNMQAFGPLSSRHIAPQLGTIGSTLTPLADLSRGQKGWGDKLDTLISQIYAAKADNAGEANQPVPDKYRSSLNPIYAAGGSMNLRPAQPMPAEEMADTLRNVKSGALSIPDAIRFAKAGNYDTRELERQIAQMQVAKQ
jgi:hypothetical protein